MYHYSSVIHWDKATPSLLSLLLSLSLPLLSNCSVGLISGGDILIQYVHYNTVHIAIYDILHVHKKSKCWINCDSELWMMNKLNKLQLRSGCKIVFPPRKTWAFLKAPPPRSVGCVNMPLKNVTQTEKNRIQSITGQKYEWVFISLSFFSLWKWTDSVSFKLSIFISFSLLCN